MLRRRIILLLLALLLLIQTGPVTAEAAGSVYFTAVNKDVLDLTDSTMPFWSGGLLYVPSAIFANRRKELGLSYSYNAAKQVLILYSNDNYLTFDTNKEYAEDKAGNLYFQKPIRRSGVLFLPIDVVASSFSLHYSSMEVPRGYLVWIRSDSANMPENIFADASYYRMEDKYNRYIKSKEVVVPEEPVTVVPEEPPEEVEEPTAVSGKRIYLCIRASDAERVSAQLDVLDSLGEPAAFYCTLDFLEEQGDLLRRMTAAGRSIGMVLNRSGGQSLAEQAAAGNQALFQATCGKTRLVYLEGGSERTSEELTAAGYRCLRPGLNRAGQSLTNLSGAITLLRRVSERTGTVSIWLPDISENGLRAFLTAASEEENQFLSMTEVF